MSCGVETMTAPDSGTDCAMVSWASPVPGGRSQTRTSSSPQFTSRSSWLMALITIGPRQIIGVSSAIMKPIDITLMPKFCIGSRRLPSRLCGLPLIPIRRGCDGP